MHTSAFWKPKSITLMFYFLKYDWQKNTAIWLTKRIFSKDLSRKIASNFKIVDSNVHSSVMTIYRYFYQFFLPNTKTIYQYCLVTSFQLKKNREKALKRFQKSIFPICLMHSYLNCKFQKFKNPKPRSQKHPWINL